MIWQIDLWLMVLLVFAAIVALEARDLLVAVVALTAYSLLMVLLFAGMGAPDVALTEAALGAGLTGIFLILALLFTNRESED